VPSSVTNRAEENPMKKLPQVSDTKLLVPLPVKIRKYSEDYLSQGFSFVMIENVPRLNVLFVEKYYLMVI